MAARNRKAALASFPGNPFACEFSRCVSFLSFNKAEAPSFLFTSGRSGRCNPSGVRCLYVSENERVALAEFAAYSKSREPRILFYGTLEAEAILDFEAKACRETFGMGRKDFFTNYRLSAKPTPLQELGRAVSGQGRIAAMRYPSFACEEKGETGFNFAIFPDALRAPWRLLIHGNAARPLQAWPD